MDPTLFGSVQDEDVENKDSTLHSWRDCKKTLSVQLTATGSDDAEAESGESAIAFERIETRAFYEAKKILTEAKVQGWRRRMLISLPTLFFAILAAAVLVVLHVAVNLDEENDAIHYASRGATAALAGPLVFSAMLALLPSDTCLVRTCALIDCAFSCGGATIVVRRAFGYFGAAQESNLCSYRGADLPCWLVTAIGVEYICEAILLSGNFVYVVCHMRQHSARLLRALWAAYGIFPLGQSILRCTFAVLMFAVGATPLGIVYLVSFPQLVTGLASLRPGVREFLQNLLASQGEAASAAAAVSTLLDGRAVDDVLATARAGFQFVRANRFELDHMLNNSPDPELGKLTRRARFGCVDVFLSHSWHDDPVAKFNALQSWRRNFKETHKGEEPKLWFDKYCIDQARIEDSLASMPVYLAGCEKLLVLCGKTYLKRLWCIVELFVFIEMGGLPENIEILFLSGNGDDELNGIRESAESFQILEARCESEYDTQRLRPVLEAGQNGLAGVTDFILNNFVQCNAN